MTEVILKNYYEKGRDEHVEEMIVHHLGETFIWFEFKLDNGKKVQTLCFRGEV